MIPIFKGTEPKSLCEYRSKRDGKYGEHVDFTEVKEDIRKSLLKEQGYLCAYCMCKIKDDGLTTKVEHCHSQDRHPDKDLEYKNMLALCLGKTGQNSHCDGKKSLYDKTIDLKFNPSEETHHRQLKIKYLPDGIIRSEDEEFNVQLNSILGLNCKTLVKNRKSTIDGVFDILGKSPGSRTPVEIQKLIGKWQSTDINGHKKEYCGIAIYYLEKKLRRIT